MKQQIERTISFSDYGHLCANLNVLESICRHHSPRNYLEVGVSSGDSLRVVVKNSPDLRYVTLVDTWGLEFGGSGFGSHDHINVLLDSCGYHGVRYFLDGDSRVMLSELVTKSGRRSDCSFQFDSRLYQFDLIHIDGDHSPEVATMEKKAEIVFIDAMPHGVGVARRSR